MHITEGDISADIIRVKCPNCGHTQNVLLSISGVNMFAVPKEWMSKICEECGEEMKEEET